MIGCNGDLIDTRHSYDALRHQYRYTFSIIENVSQLKATLRNGQYTSVGCYPLFLITSDGAALCFECGRAEFSEACDSIRKGLNDGWRIVGCAVNYEDTECYCDHCSARIKSAYSE